MHKHKFWGYSIGSQPNHAPNERQAMQPRGCRPVTSFPPPHSSYCYCSM